jgi:hypothetical protein
MHMPQSSKIIAGDITRKFEPQRKEEEPRQILRSLTRSTNSLFQLELLAPCSIQLITVDDPFILRKVLFFELYSKKLLQQAAPTITK